MRTLRATLVLLTLAAAAPAARADLPPLIPRDTLFGNPVKTNPQVAPDGKRIGYLAPDKAGALNVFVQTIGRKDDRQVTHDKKRGVRKWFWQWDSGQLLCLQDQDGDENSHVFQTTLDGTLTRDLTPFVGAKADGVSLDPAQPNVMLVGLNARNPQLMDMMRVDLTTGSMTTDTANPGDVIGWSVDNHMNVHAATAMMPDGGMEIRIKSG